MSFPHIEHIDDLLPHIKDKPEIIRIDKDWYTVFDYVYQTPDTFDNPYALECRGIKFDKDTGKIVARPFHKFFNIGEKQNYEDIPWDTHKHIVMDKMDGSMVHGARSRYGSITLMTRKGLTDIASEARHYIRIYEGDFIEDCLTKGITPIFEYVSPTNRIVIPYEEGKIVLLACRDNVTGDYYDLDDFDTNLIERVSVIKDIEKFTKKEMDKARDLKGKEGYVIHFPETGHLLKVKSEDYVLRHRVKNDYETSFRHILKMVCERNITKEIDDISTLLDKETVDKILSVNSRVNMFVHKIKNAVERALYQRVFVLPRKEFAEWLKSPQNSNCFKEYPDFHNIAFKVKDIVEDNLVNKTEDALFGSTYMDSDERIFLEKEIKDYILRKFTSSEKSAEYFNSQYLDRVIEKD